MRKLILVCALLLSSCLHVMKTNPEGLRQHCAALGQVTADRQMNTYSRQGGRAYDAAEVARAAEKKCLEKKRPS